MVAPSAGAIVLVRFPFSDLSRSKLRPAVVLASVARGDRILCQVTSKPYGDPAAIELDQAAFVSGSLRLTSYARPGKLFTASQDLITSQVGTLTATALARIVDGVVAVIRGGGSAAADDAGPSTTPLAPLDSPRRPADGGKSTS